jgi:hypothetical protein
MDVLNHPWFVGVDWDGVFKKEVPPPWTPEIKDILDDSYFDNYPDSAENNKLPTS